MMKKVLTILFAAILLASGVQISLDRHYCGGRLADIKISVTGKMASCGMEQSESSCPVHPVIGKKCCEDQVSYFCISNKYYPVFFNVTHPAAEKNIKAISAVCNFVCDLYKTNINNWVLPPGDYLSTSFTQSEICIFRI